VQNIFVTGGHSQLANFDARLSSSIRSVLPVGSPIRVSRPADARLAAWQGLAQFARTDAFADAGVTLAEYMEQGSDYVRDHPLRPSLVSL
jgi:actin-related protein 5